MKKLASEGFNTMAVIALIEPTDLEAIGITGIGFRKKIMNAVDQLKRAAWKPTASVDSSADGRAYRCSNCHRYRTKGAKHACGEADKCTNVATCPTNFVQGHSEALKRKRKELREQQQKQKSEDTEQSKKQKDQSADRFLEEELKRTLEGSTTSAPAAASSTSVTMSAPAPATVLIKAEPSNGASSEQWNEENNNTHNSEESSEGGAWEPTGPPPSVHGPSDSLPTPYHVVIKGESIGVVVLPVNCTLKEARDLVNKQLKLAKDSWDYEHTAATTVAGAFPLFKSQWGAAVPALMIRE